MVMRARLKFLVGLWIGAAFLCFLPSANAETLRITSTPSGATVEIDGVIAGTTPFSKKYPGGYFHKTKTALGARLEHPMVARIILTGYGAKEIQLTVGPMEWIALNGRKEGEYWLFKDKEFDVHLDPLDQSLTGSISETIAPGVQATLWPLLRL